MRLATLQKLDKVPDDKLCLYLQPWPSEERRPLLVSAHPRSGDIYLCSLKVEVVCHHGDRHKLGDKGFDVFEPRWDVEQELVARQPDPFPQNSDPFG